MIDFIPNMSLNRNPVNATLTYLSNFCGGRQIIITATKKEKLWKLTFSPLFFT